MNDWLWNSWSQDTTIREQGGLVKSCRFTDRGRESKPAQRRHLRSIPESKCIYRWLCRCSERSPLVPMPLNRSSDLCQSVKMPPEIVWRNPVVPPPAHSGHCAASHDSSPHAVVKRYASRVSVSRCPRCTRAKLCLTRQMCRCEHTVHPYQTLHGRKEKTGSVSTRCTCATQRPEIKKTGSVNTRCSHATLCSKLPK